MMKLLHGVYAYGGNVLPKKSVKYNLIKKNNITAYRYEEIDY
ncbi:MAG: hypothetical protein ACOC2J_02420 [bacterium]